jgi:hypothetical protein
MSNDLPGLRGLTAYIAARPNRIWVACEATDEGAMRIVHPPDPVTMISAPTGLVTGTPASGVDDDDERGAWVVCSAIGPFYRDGDEHDAHAFCDASRPDEPTYVHPGIGYRVLHNRRLYGHAMQAAAAAGHIVHIHNRRFGEEPVVPEPQPCVLRVELGLLEPEGLSPFESFVFAERMMQLWGERMAQRRDLYENPPPPKKPKKTLSEAERGRRREKQLANAIARGYRAGCLRPGHRARRVCRGGCVNRDSRPDLNHGELLFAIGEGIWEHSVLEIRTRRARRTYTRPAPYTECEVCTARWPRGVGACMYCGGACRHVAGLVPAGDEITVSGGTGGGGGGGGGGIAIIRQLARAVPEPMREAVLTGFGAALGSAVLRRIAAHTEAEAALDDSLPPEGTDE